MIHIVYATFCQGKYSTQIHLLLGGFCTLLLMPLVGVSMHKFDPRVVLTLGMGITSVAVLLM